MKNIKLKTILENVERTRKNCLQYEKNNFGVFCFESFYIFNFSVNFFRKNGKESFESLQDNKNLFSVENSNFLTNLDIAKIIYKYATRKA
jgi:CRISPR/Cas system-associated protein Cas5 (RAMP superfamily)